MYSGAKDMYSGVKDMSFGAAVLPAAAAQTVKNAEKTLFSLEFGPFGALYKEDTHDVLSRMVSQTTG
jgi:hypothetical protein